MVGEVVLDNHGRKVATLRVELLSPAPAPVVGPGPVQGGLNSSAVLKHMVSVKQGSSEEVVESMYVAEV